VTTITGLNTDRGVPLADRDSPTRPGRFIKMGIYLYVNLKFNRLKTLFLSWGDRATARYGPQDGPPVAVPTLWQQVSKDTRYKLVTLVHFFNL
jgi:hypothetical protein